MKKTLALFNVLVLMALGLTCPGTAQAEMSAEKLLNTLHKTNEREIRLGQFAVRKGYSETTRNYGKRLIADYREADQKVANVAKQEGVTLKKPDCIMTELEMKRLRAHHGAEFDKFFAETMERHHKRDIAKLRKVQDVSSLPPTVQELIMELLPRVQIHQDQAEQIASKDLVKDVLQ